MRSGAALVRTTETGTDDRARACPRRRSPSGSRRGCPEVTKSWLGGRAGRRASVTEVPGVRDDGAVGVARADAVEVAVRAVAGVGERRRRRLVRLDGAQDDRPGRRRRRWPCRPCRPGRRTARSAPRRWSRRASCRRGRCPVLHRAWRAGHRARQGEAGRRGRLVGPVRHDPGAGRSVDRRRRVTGPADRLGEVRVDQSHRCGRRSRRRPSSCTWPPALRVTVTRLLASAAVAILV